MEKNSTRLGLKIIENARYGEKFIILEENITKPFFCGVHRFDWLFHHSNHKDVILLGIKRVFTSLREEYGDDENKWELHPLRREKTDIVRNLTLQEYCRIGQVLKTYNLFYNKKKKILIEK